MTMSAVLDMHESSGMLRDVLQLCHAGALRDVIILREVHHNTTFV